MHVSEIMSSPVVVTRKGTKIKHTKSLLVRKGIHAIPVLEEDGVIVGIVSATDLAKAADEEVMVEELMSNRIHVVQLNNRIKDAAAIMVKHKVHHLPVMDEGKIAGIISSMDILKTID